MYDLIYDLIGYTGTTSNISSNIVYCCMVLITLGVVITIDLVYKLLLRFMPRDGK